MKGRKKRAKTKVAKKRRGKRKNPALLLIRNPSKRKRSKRAPPQKRRTTPRSSSRRTQARRRASSHIHPLVRALVNQKTCTVPELLAVCRQVPEFGRMIRRHKAFHGTYPDNLEFLEADDPTLRYTTTLGDPRAIEYSVPASSARAGTPFRHRFDAKRSRLSTDATGKKLVFLRRKGSRLRVTERGIIG